MPGPELSLWPTSAVYSVSVAEHLDLQGPQRTCQHTSVFNYTHTHTHTHTHARTHTRTHMHNILRSATTLKPLTGELNNTDYLGTVAPVEGWDGQSGLEVDVLEAGKMGKRKNRRDYDKLWWQDHCKWGAKASQSGPIPQKSYCSTNCWKSSCWLWQKGVRTHSASQLAAYEAT